MTERNKQIIEFANKWIEKFQDERNGYVDLIDDPSFPDTCFALKFDMDCGHGFCKKYRVDLHDAPSVLDKVDDIDYLASAIFSEWRYFNHWANSASEILEYRDWFVVMLTKLKELAGKK